MQVIALTGGIGCGKSLGAQYFARLGAFVLDADELARIAIERGSKGFDEVISIFGDSILKDGDIDRGALGNLIFSDSQARVKLEKIIHPFVRNRFEEAVAALRNDEVLIYEIPLLIETNSVDRFDLVITVESKIELRIDRLLARGMGAPEIQARIDAQATRSQREIVADFIIENDGSEEELLRKVENIWDSIQNG